MLGLRNDFASIYEILRRFFRSTSAQFIGSGPYMIEAGFLRASV